ncbi:acyl-CoA dehydrogenase family protein [Pseudomonas morbosilactucae]|uniref:acyl-CoA dehydrogenase family protein n=1 Tax=Pseudomonas morbosilactucae TaxID=2938197 RepID=UPI0031345587
MFNGLPDQPGQNLQLAERVRAFVEQVIIPRETQLAADDVSASQCTAALAQQAKDEGLWGLAYPDGQPLQRGSLQAYLPLAEQEGRSEYGPAILGAEAALDTYMLQGAGEAIRQDFLKPLLAGKVQSSYGMSEPDSIGSIPATLSTQARLVHGQWRLNGRKWFICRAEHASFMTVVARTGEGALSMFVVPTQSPGFNIERRLEVLGRFQGQCEISLTNVDVPQAYMLGVQGQGLALMQQRLGLGRLLRAVQWLGLAQRCIDLMGVRIASPRGEQARLADKQLVRLRMFDAFAAVAGARAVLRDAAAKFDHHVDTSIEVNLAKLTASRALSVCADSAIQIYGAEGLSALSPLAGIYRCARTTHILDAPMMR